MCVYDPDISPIFVSKGKMTNIKYLVLQFLKMIFPSSNCFKNKSDKVSLYVEDILIIFTIIKTQF